MKLIVLLALFILASCNSPLSGDIKVSLNDDGQSSGGSTAGGAAGGGAGGAAGGAAGGGGGGAPFTLNIPFTTGTEASYIINEPTQVEFVGDLVRLKAKTFVDQNNTVNGFAGGTKNGVTWDIANSMLRLNSQNNLNEHSIHWSPEILDVIAYYKLNEATYTGVAGQMYDDGPASFHGQSNGNLVNSTGKLRFAATFNGVSHVTVPDYDYFEDQAAYTIVFWFKPTNLNGTPQGLIGKRIAEDDNETYSIYLHTNNQLYVDIDGSGDRFASITEFENNKWYHIALTFDGTQAAANRVRLYVNGQLDRVASETSTTIPNYTGTLRFGSLDASDNFNFTGQMDEIVFWKHTLNNAEIQYMHERQSFKVTGEFISRVIDANDTDTRWTYFSPKVTIPFSKELPATNGSELVADYSAIAPNLMTGLVSYWNFNDTPKAINDLLGSNDGTGYNDITMQDLRSVFGQSAAFNGGMFVVNATLMNNMPAFSLGGWIHPSFQKNFAGGSTVAIIGKRGVVAVGLKNGNLCARSEIDAAEVCSPTTINTGEWTHYMVTGDASTFSLYINGKFVNSLAHAGANYGTSGNDFEIGSRVWDGADNFYVGLMDETALWNRALTPNEVLNLYRRGGNTLQYQVRSCANPDCSDQDAAYGQGWKGPGNDSIFFFSENFNYQTVFDGLPIGTPQIEAMRISFEDFDNILNISDNRYFQYKAVFRSNDTNTLCDYGSGAVMCSPELKSVTLGPSYSTRINTVTNTIAIGAAFTAFDLAGFTETMGPNDWNGTTWYTVSADGTNFYYHDGTSWVLSDGSDLQTTDGWSMSAVLPTFPLAVGIGTLQIKTYLLSNGYTQAEVDNLEIKGTN